MEDRGVFNSSFISNEYCPEITSDYSARTDPAVFSNPHITNDLCTLCDPCPFAHLRGLAVEFEDCHNFLFLLEKNNNLF